tara:strand:+ start:217 stop:990 length:774 start_codon:yes stop_codon:yes gene_type:complete
MDGLTLIIVSIVSAIIVAIFIYKKILPLIAELEKKEQKKLNELDIFINECNSKFYSELQALDYISKTSSTYLAHIVMEEHLFKKYYMPEHLFRKYQDIILNIDFNSHFHLIATGEGTPRNASYHTYFDGTWETTYAIYDNFYFWDATRMIAFNEEKNIKSSQKKKFDLVKEKAFAFSLIYIIIKKLNEKIKDKADEIGINKYPQETSLKRMKELVYKAANEALNFAREDDDFSKDDIKLFFEGYNPTKLPLNDKGYD